MVNQVLLVVILSIVLISVSTIIAFLRLYARVFVVKKPGLDDLLAAVSFCFIVTYAALEISATTYGAGRDIDEVSPEDVQKLKNSLVAKRMILTLAFGFTRLSIVAFFPRLFNTHRYMIAVCTMAGMIAGTTLGFFIYHLTYCSPVAAAWDHTIENATCRPFNTLQPSMYIQASIFLGYDIVTLLYPIWLVSRTMLSSFASLKVCIVFGVGIFSILAGVVRLVFLIKVNVAENLTYNITRPTTYTDLELHTAFWTACFPSLQPLIRDAARKMGSNYNSGILKSSIRPRQSAARGRMKKFSMEQHDNLWKPQVGFPGGTTCSDVSDVDIGQKHCDKLQQENGPGDIVKMTELLQSINSTAGPKTSV